MSLSTIGGALTLLTQLVIFSSTFNLLVVYVSAQNADLLRFRYDFFQTLCKLAFISNTYSCILILSKAIVGGLILLVNMGPGGFSVDEKKKNF